MWNDPEVRASVLTTFCFAVLFILLLVCWR